MVQGVVVAGATGLSLIPILQGYFHLTYEVALCVVIVQAFLIGTAPLLYGDPYAPGWVTPSIPLVLSMMVSMGGGPDASPETTAALIQAIIGFTLLNALFFLLMGVTGLGRRIVEKLPPPIKAGIILGAAIEAFLHEFADGDRSYLLRAPIAGSAAVGVCLFLVYSVPLLRAKMRYRPLAVVASLGLAPGFLTAMGVGYFTGELQFSVQGGINRPPFGEMFEQLSLLRIGLPPVEVMVKMLPLVLVVYIIGFGDMITADALLQQTHEKRRDEQFDINPTRTHLSVGLRNLFQTILAGPFPVTHGPLWTGVQVVVTERYKHGRWYMDSIYGGISAYYLWGIPILLFLTPITSLLQPMLPIALAMTILLTGFACGYVAMAIPRDPVERGVALTTAMALALFGAWQGLVVGAIMTVALVGWRPSEIALETPQAAAPQEENHP